MNHHLSFEDDLLIVTPLVSRLDAHAAPALRAVLLQQIEAGCQRVKIDLEHVQFIDSSGLGAIVAARKHLGADGDLAVCSLAKTVRSMFEVTALDRVIAIGERS